MPAAVRVLCPAEAASLMQGDVRVLADWRARGCGPPHVMVGGMPRYTGGKTVRMDAPRTPPLDSSPPRKWPS